MSRVQYFTAYCTNAACHHARRPHPIRGSVISYDLGTIDPDSATGECPACDAPLDGEPLFSTDEEAQEERA